MGRDGAVVAVRRRRSRTRRSAPGGRRSGSSMLPTAPRGRVAGRRADRRSPIPPAANTAAVASRPRREYRAVQTDPGAHLLGGGDPPMGLEPVAPDEVRERPDRRAVAALGEDAAACSVATVSTTSRSSRRATASAAGSSATSSSSPADSTTAASASASCTRRPAAALTVPVTNEESHGPPTKPGPMAGCQGDQEGRSAARSLGAGSIRSSCPSVSSAPQTLREHVRDRRGQGAQVHRRVGDRDGARCDALDLHGQRGDLRAGCGELALQVGGCAPRCRPGSAGPIRRRR